MTKFATIDLASGYVWWVGEAESAIDACQKSDEESGYETDDGEYMETPTCDADTTTGGYAVYQVPADFDVTDGQAEDEIEATESHRLVGLFRFRVTA